MFWLDRDGEQPRAEDAKSGDVLGTKAPGAGNPGGGAVNTPASRGPAPHVVISGRQLREEILSYGPAFLEPHRYAEPDAFRALVTVLAAYALGSRTAARLVRERQMADPSWQPPSRREAMQVVSSLNRLRQYLPYLLGQRIQAAAGAGAGAVPSATPSQPPPPPNTRTNETNIHTPRAPVRIAPSAPNVSKPVINTRPPPPRASGVVVRPVISLNRNS